LSLLPLSGCGDAEDWNGTDPSGSHIRVVDVTPTSLEPDVSETDCGGGKSDALTNSYVEVTLKNMSTPNTPTGESTNSYVTMNRYRVDYVGLDKTVQIPPIEGGQSVGLAAEGTEASMTVMVMDIARLNYIRSHYPIGSNDNLRLLGKVTVIGTDAFQETVSTEVDVMLVVANYNRCSTASTE
jgi:hypothetical protein